MSPTIVRSEARPAYRPYVTHISAITELSPHFVRVTLHGEALGDFGTDGLDQRIKLVLPFADGTITDVGFERDEVIAAGDWYARWRELPDAARNPIRTYTVRAVRPALREIDVDVVRHGAAPGSALGPAATWIANAQIGDALVVAGPDATSTQSHVGIDWHPGDATRLLIVGDETAVPAALAILEQLPEHVEVDALLEVPERADILPVVTRADALVTWLDRASDASDAKPGQLLVPALERWVSEHPAAYAEARGSREQLAEVDVDVERIWDSPDAAGHRAFYAWLAGEQSAIKRMRRHLVTDTGIDRGAVAFMGYWRFGVAEIG